MIASRFILNICVLIVGTNCYDSALEIAGEMARISNGCDRLGPGMNITVIDYNNKNELKKALEQAFQYISMFYNEEPHNTFKKENGTHLKYIYSSFEQTIPTERYVKYIVIECFPDERVPGIRCTTDLCKLDDHKMKSLSGNHPIPQTTYHSKRRISDNNRALRTVLTFIGAIVATTIILIIFFTLRRFRNNNEKFHKVYKQSHHIAKYETLGKLKVNKDFNKTTVVISDNLWGFNV